MDDEHDLKVSVITPVLNGEATISSCIESVLYQSYDQIEHIVLDALSVDQTVTIVKKYPADRVTLISEKDKGLYDAMNKGIHRSTGDIISFLGADDMLAHPHVIRDVISQFHLHPETDIVYGDLVYVDRNDTSEVNRYWKSSPYRPGLYRTGWLPANTAFFIRKTSLGPEHIFDIQYRYSADYDFNYRLLEIDKMGSVYLPEILVKMRSGGISNSGLKNIYNSLKECHDILRSHRVNFPMLYIINTLLYRFRQVFIPPQVRKEMKNSMKPGAFKSKTG